MELILDLGCGAGRTLDWFGVTPEDKMIGVDLDHQRIRAASLSFPERTYFVSRGEALGIDALQFTRVIANMSLPYMNIPQALSEMYRVLLPGGKVSLTLHRSSFTWHELKSTRGVTAFLFRLYVLLNGFFFYLFGRTFACPFTARTESFQTERGMRLALERCGFTEIHFGMLGPRFFADAVKPQNNQTQVHQGSTSQTSMPKPDSGSDTFRTHTWNPLALISTGSLLRVLSFLLR